MSEDSFFTFTLSEGVFALPINYVREVINYEPITQIPKSLSYIKGVVNIRGSVVTVIDFRKMFGFAEVNPQESNSIIVLEIDQGNEAPLVIGMLADSVDVVTKLEFVESENFDYGSLPGKKEFISQIAKKDDKFVLIMSIKKIVKAIEEDIDKLK